MLRRTIRPERPGVKLSVKCPEFAFKAGVLVQHLVIGLPGGRDPRLPTESFPATGTDRRLAPFSAREAMHARRFARVAYITRRQRPSAHSQVIGATPAWSEFSKTARRGLSEARRGPAYRRTPARPSPRVRFAFRHFADSAVDRPAQLGQGLQCIRVSHVARTLLSASKEERD